MNLHEQNCAKIWTKQEQINFAHSPFNLLMHTSMRMSHQVQLGLQKTGSTIASGNDFYTNFPRLYVMTQSNKQVQICGHSEDYSKSFWSSLTQP